jgi:hypothetical protein
MNTGQMLISMAAMILLGTVVLNVNRNALTNNSTMDETKYEIMAVSLGTAIIESAFNKSFDEETADNKIVDNLTDLSVNLGREGGESTEIDFDDIDDYNNFSGSTNNDTTYSSANMYYRCKVHYVDPDVSLDSVSSRTWHKKISVYISSPYIQDSSSNIIISKIYSHYYFR